MAMHPLVPKIALLLGAGATDETIKAEIGKETLRLGRLHRTLASANTRPEGFYEGMTPASAQALRTELERQQHDLLDNTLQIVKDIFAIFKIQA